LAPWARSGAEVQQLDKKTIEARAIKEGVIAAHRRQVSQDTAALQQHLDDLNAKAVAMRQTIDSTEVTFLRALADATLEAYKRNAIEFVRSNLPALHSVAARLKSRTGEGPEWAKRVFPGLTINWSDNERVPDPCNPTDPRFFSYKKTRVWPPGLESVLVSGEPVFSDDDVEALIVAIRSEDNRFDLQAAVA